MVGLLLSEEHGDGGETSAPDTPGPGLLLATVIVSVVLNGLVMPLAVWFHHRRRRGEADRRNGYQEIPAVDNGADEKGEASEEEEEESPGGNDCGRTDSPGPHALLPAVIRFDAHSSRILSYAVPFTLSSLATAVFDGAIVGVLGHYAGTAPMVAYVEVVLLFGMAHEFLLGPFHALATVASSAVGAGNRLLAGQYVQLAAWMYALSAAPVLGWFFFRTEETILRLGWGDEEVAGHAQAFVRYYVWSEILGDLADGFGEYLNVIEHQVFSTAISVGTGGALVASMYGTAMLGTLSLESTGRIFIATNFLALCASVVVSHRLRWLDADFIEGSLSKCALMNHQALRSMVRVSVPISISSLLESMEWAVLGIFAANMGTNQVAAWAIIGNIWEIFDSLVYGIGDAAEIQVARHLGKGKGQLAKLSAYKSIFLGMGGAFAVLFVFLALMPEIPAFFTPDAILQDLIASVLPFLTVGYLILMLGMISWWIVGATGRYDLGTWIHLTCSWGVTIPLGALSTYRLDFDLRGLAAAVVLGYSFIGCWLSFLVYTTDWVAVAKRVHAQNEESDSDEESEFNGDGCKPETTFEESESDEDGCEQGTTPTYQGL